MIVTVQSTAHPRPRYLYGPGDLKELGANSTVTVSGVPDRDRDFGLWAPALGEAVLRGASVVRKE